MVPADKLSKDIQGVISFTCIRLLFASPKVVKFLLGMLTKAKLNGVEEKSTTGKENCLCP